MRELGAWLGFGCCGRQRSESASAKCRVYYGACGRFPTSTALVGPSQLNPVWVYGFSLRASSALAKREFGHEETGLESVLRARMCIGSRMVSQIVDRASARAGSRRTWNVWGNVDKKRTSIL